MTTTVLFYEEVFYKANPRRFPITVKELTVEPGVSVTIRDKAAYGCVVVQGRGEFERFICESPTLIRYCCTETLLGLTCGMPQKKV
jgi:hypothetical protein